MNYFVEGIQGSGKSTLVRRLSEKHPECRTIMEGDYSPIELAWCGRMSDVQYSQVLERWNDLKDQICSKSHKEGDYWIGRTQYDSPEVDCEVLIKVVGRLSLVVGQFYDVKITKAEEFDLYGDIC